MTQVTELHVMMLGLRSVSGAQGGVETHVTELGRALVANGIKVTVLARKGYQAENGPLTEVALPFLPGARFEALSHSVLGVLYAAWHRPDLVHIHAIGPALTVPLARAIGLRVVVTHHGEDYAREKWGGVARQMLRWGEWCQARLSDRAIAISPALSRTLNNRYGPRFSSIPNGVPVFGPVDGQDHLERFGVAPGRYILSVARLVPEKQQRFLLDCFEHADLAPDVRLVLVGGADHESSYTRDLRARAERSSRILLPGQLRGVALAQLFSYAGLFALPSTHEGLPIALLEALSYGAPVLVSDLPGTRDIALPETCYRPAASRECWTAALTRHFSRPVERPDWQECLARFRWPKIAADTANLYRDVIVKHGSRNRHRTQV